MAKTEELPRLGGTGSGLGGLWRVVVLNDDHNTFDHVAETLARFVPGVSWPTVTASPIGSIGPAVRLSGAVPVTTRSPTGRSSTAPV